ncbi:MAG: hypothetical protein CMP91_09965 [Gammaproteobacteria bacterium]|nr:hypothetical protein [Gammaproteobacteria bacterium]|tara:strand:- start:437671 stop:437919 length:249 start_codon:yes stop_codon:yes gene_type:complete
MSDIKFTEEEKSRIIEKIKTYFEDELKQEIGQFDAEFLLDFFTKQIGPYFYNRGLYDARDILTQMAENIDEAIYAIEKDTAD